MPLVTAGVLQQACDCVLSVDIVAFCIDMRGVGVATGELVCTTEGCVSFETADREADLESEERDADIARATARTILCGGICQGTLM